MRKDYQNNINNNFDVQNTQGIKVNSKADDRLNENYTNKDQNWSTGKSSRDIYISTPNDTHDKIANHHNDPNNKEYFLPEKGYPGVSGFFTNEDTARKSFTDNGKFDSVQLGHNLQQAPHFHENKAKMAELTGQKYCPEYNGHLDCFRVNPEKMQEHFGTTDFYAAMSKCTENKPWGEGGGFQGYNPYINEMINKGCLDYVPEKSRTCDSNACLDYADRKKIAYQQASAVNDYIENNGIKGSQNQHLGYNELPQNNEIKAGTNNTLQGISSSNVAATTGGGSQAPPTNDSSSNSQMVGQKPASPVTATDTNQVSDSVGRKPSLNDNADGNMATGKNNMDGDTKKPLQSPLTNNNSSGLTSDNSFGM